MFPVSKKTVVRIFFFKLTPRLRDNASAYLVRLGLSRHGVRGQHVGGGPHRPLRLLLAACWDPLLETADCLGSRLTSALCLRLLLLAARRVDFCIKGKYAWSNRKKQSVLYVSSLL